jgi:hypothetical protein
MKKSVNEWLLFLLFVSISLSVTYLGDFVQNSYAQGQGSIITEPNTTNKNDTKVKDQTSENLSNFFGSPMYVETAHNSVGPVTVNTNPPQTRDSYNAKGILRDVGNVTDMATFMTTHLDNGKSTSIGRGNFTTSDGEIANYTGQDAGMTDSNGIEIYKGIQIFSSNPEGKLGFLDNAIGLYVYKYWPNGTVKGTIWEWK